MYLAEGSHRRLTSCFEAAIIDCSRLMLRHPRNEVWTSDAPPGSVCRQKLHRRLASKVLHSHPSEKQEQGIGSCIFPSAYPS